MSRWKVGRVEITRVKELEIAGGTRFILPDASPENVKPIEWLAPHFMDPEGKLVMSVHALILASEGRRIIVDTCIGNDKPRPIPGWNLRDGPFLRDLAAAGHPREEVDVVLCTHLHVDHVGWNTMRVDGRWVPTFPNARYLITREEWEHWDREPDETSATVLGDSVRPVFEAGLVDLVEPYHRITDEVWLEPTRGHTPGHVSVRISSNGEEAVITGDLIHHPCQMGRPQWNCAFDWDPEQACKTRVDFLSRCADAAPLVIGTHFPAPTAGRVVRDGEVFRFVT